jgi:hypothetical protein
MTKENKEEHIGQEIAAAIATVPKGEQKEVLEQIKHLRYHVASPIITAYKNAEPEIQKLFREGKIKPEEIKQQILIPTIDNETDFTEQEIKFETKWENDNKEYTNDLIIWKTIPTNKFTKADFNYYLKQLKHTMEKAQDVIARLEKEAKK